MCSLEPATTNIHHKYWHVWNNQSVIFNFTIISKVVDKNYFSSPKSMCEIFIVGVCITRIPYF